MQEGDVFAFVCLFIGGSTSALVLARRMGRERVKREMRGYPCPCPGWREVQGYSCPGPSRGMVGEGQGEEQSCPVLRLLTPGLPNPSPALQYSSPHPSLHPLRYLPLAPHSMDRIVWQYASCIFIGITFLFLRHFRRFFGGKIFQMAYFCSQKN